MKINIYNTKPCCVTFCDEDNSLYDAPYPFDDLNAAIAYCEEEIDVRQQAISAAIWDADTGEVYAVCGFDEDDIAEEDYSDWDFGPDGDDYPDDVDETFYDPYAGCDVYETYDIGGDF